MNTIYKFSHYDHDGSIYSSLHRTKKGAYKVLNKYLNDTFNENRDEALTFGVPMEFNDKYDHIFRSTWYDIVEVKLNN